MPDRGGCGTLAELAAAERISRSYVCRVLRLTLLAPDIVERVMDGAPTAGLAQLLKPFPAEWENGILADNAEQWFRWGNAKLPTDGVEAAAVEAGRV